MPHMPNEPLDPHESVMETNAEAAPDVVDLLR
jgi:hypothetical protein